MNEGLQSAISIRKLIYNATTSSNPNLGGHHGVRGFEASIGSEILKAFDTFIGALRMGKVNKDDVEQVRGQCSLARTMDIITDKEMKKIDDVLDKIKEEL